MTIPGTWSWTTIGEICELNPPLTSLPADDELVSFVPLPSVEVATGRLDPSRARLWKEVKSGFTRFQEGDVVFAKITPSMENGKAALATDLVNGRAAGTTELHVLRPTGVVEAGYLLHFVLQTSFRREARARMKGVAGQLRVPPEFMREAPIPLAPRPEQHRIVAEIEKQFTRLDAAVAALKRTQTNLKRYRAAVLKAACEGRLVPTEAELARAEGREYETGEQLLARIVAGRRARWETEQQEKYARSGKQPPLNRRSKYEEPVGPDTSALPELPEGWCWVILSQVSWIQGGIQKQPKREPALNSFPFLRVANVLRGRLDLSSVHRIELFGDELTKLRLKPDDLLIIEGNGSPSEIGRMAIWNGSIDDCVHQNHIIRARLIELLIPKYVESYWNSPRGSDAVTRVASSTSGLYTLSVTKVSGIAVPLPPYQEQQRIVAEVERRLSVLDQLEMAVDTGLKHAESLRQAILKQAFEGRLVPQDPNDEPVSVLLERVRARRNADGAEAGGKRRGGKRSSNADQLARPA